jgi:hypothetical protein
MSSSCVQQQWQPKSIQIIYELEDNLKKTIADGDLEKTESLIFQWKKKQNPNKTQFADIYLGAIHCAIHEEQETIVHSLLQKSKQNKVGVSSLTFGKAFSTGNISIATLFLDMLPITMHEKSDSVYTYKKMDINSKFCVLCGESCTTTTMTTTRTRFSKYTPLVIAVKEGHVELVRHLIQRGAEIHQDDDAALYTALLQREDEYSRHSVDDKTTMMIQCLLTECARLHRKEQTCRAIKQHENSSSSSSSNGCCQCWSHLPIEEMFFTQLINCAYGYRSKCELSTLECVLQSGAIDIHTQDDYFLRHAVSYYHLYDVGVLLVKYGADRHLASELAKSEISHPGFKRKLEQFYKSEEISSVSDCLNILALQMDVPHESITLHDAFVYIVLHSIVLRTTCLIFSQQQQQYEEEEEKEGLVV